jgi:hypothetical protein
MKCFAPMGGSRRLPPPGGPGTLTLTPQVRALVKWPMTQLS